MEITQYQALALVRGKTGKAITLKPFESVTAFECTEQRIVLVMRIAEYVDQKLCEKVARYGVRMWVWVFREGFWRAQTPIEVWDDESTTLHMKYQIPPSQE